VTRSAGKVTRSAGKVTGRAGKVLKREGHLGRMRRAAAALQLFQVCVCAAAFVAPPAPGCSAARSPRVALPAAAAPTLQCWRAIRPLNWHCRPARPRRATGRSSPNALPPRAPSASFDWHTEWFPLAPVHDLDKDAPNKLTLLGKDLVVWFHRPSARWQAFADVCPHRLVPLSEGRVEPTGVLQCAYHGRTALHSVCVRACVQ
jgi:hypothetical protein